MNIYRVSWVSGGNPNSLIAVAENPQAVSTYVKAHDEGANLEAVTTLYTDVTLIGLRDEIEPAPDWWRVRDEKFESTPKQAPAPRLVQSSNLDEDARTRPIKKK